jgi:hypothetical protein
MENKNNNIIIYTSPDNKTEVTVQMQDDTVWLTQAQMAELFDKSQATINEHIKNIYKSEELVETGTLRKFGNSENTFTKPTNYYNLDMIISVGYRVNSRRGTAFRIWATQRLREYLVQGYSINPVSYTHLRAHETM